MNRADARLAFALTAIPAAFAAGAAGARIVLTHATSAVAPDLAQPLVVVTAWHRLGVWMWLVLATSVLFASAAAVVAVHELRGRSAQWRTALAVAAAAAAALACALAWPAVFSSDVYAYAAYGDLAARGLDPYAHGPAPAHSQIATAAAWQWGGSTPVCVYGPVFVAFARLVVALGRGKAAATLLLFRLASCAGFALAALFLYAALPGGASTRGRRLAATAALALNPVALWSVAEGHNDALMLAVALGGAALVRRGSAALGGATIALSSLLKAPGILVGAALAAVGTAPEKMRRAAAGVAAGAAFAVLVGAPEALRSLGDVDRHGHYQPQYSLQALAVLTARTLGLSHSTEAGVAIALLLCAAIALAGIVALRGGDPAALGYLAIATWLALPNAYPWYALWVLPVAVIALDLAPNAALWAATISIVMRYLPDAFGSPTPDRQAMITAIELAPLLYAAKTLFAAPAAKEAAAG
jgi:alpha-1,6-mannosyltransferase